MDGPQSLQIFSRTPLKLYACMHMLYSFEDTYSVLCYYRLSFHRHVIPHFPSFSLVALTYDILPYYPNLLSAGHTALYYASGLNVLRRSMSHILISIHNYILPT